MFLLFPQLLKLFCLRRVQRSIFSKSSKSTNRYPYTHGLTLMTEKTDVIVLTRKRVRNEIFVFSAGHVVRSKSSFHYLGIQIDKNMGFAEPRIQFQKGLPLRRGNWDFLYLNLKAHDKNILAYMRASQRQGSCTRHRSDRKSWLEVRGW